MFWIFQTTFPQTPTIVKAHTTKMLLPQKIRNKETNFQRKLKLITFDSLTKYKLNEQPKLLFNLRLLLRAGKAMNEYKYVCMYLVICYMCECLYCICVCCNVNMYKCHIHYTTCSTYTQKKKTCYERLNENHVKSLLLYTIAVAVAVMVVAVE